jgi:alpha-L-rhamnosidase
MTLATSWIWSAADPSARNVLVQFRRAFVLDAPPAAARLHISADTRYILYVNNVRLGYGPARSYHTHYEYDTYPVAALLHSPPCCTRARM